MKYQKTYMVFVPVVIWVSIPQTAWSPEEALENAGAIARARVAENPQDHEKVVPSNQIPWILANLDGSSPNRMEKIHIAGRGEIWDKAGKNKMGYGY